MEKVILTYFENSDLEDIRLILQVLRNLGVDSRADLRYVSEDDLKELKVVHKRKLMAICEEVQDEGESFEKHEPEDQQYEVEPILEATTISSERAQTTKRLGIATGVLGGVTAAAVPLAVFAALFPPITLPIAVAVGVGAGVVGAATAGTGIATAVMANKSDERNKTDDDKEKLL